MKYEQEYSSNQRIHKELSKDIINKKLSGVCAGIAKYYDFSRLAIRIAAVVALFMLPVVTGVAYVVASVLLPENKKY
jgi:phage shock protein PspC (stress-responsive transcriptional regulator)